MPKLPQHCTFCHDGRYVLVYSFIDLCICTVGRGIRKTPLPVPTLINYNGLPFSRARAVALTKDGRRDLNEGGPQLASELGSRHRRARLLGPMDYGTQRGPEIDILFSFDGRRDAPKGNGLRYVFRPHHVRGV